MDCEIPQSSSGDPEHIQSLIETLPFNLRPIYRNRFSHTMRRIAGTGIGLFMIAGYQLTSPDGKLTSTAKEYADNIKRELSELETEIQQVLWNQK